MACHCNNVPVAMGPRHDTAEEILFQFEPKNVKNRPVGNGNVPGFCSLTVLIFTNYFASVH